MAGVYAWKEMYSVHVGVLDRQHQTLFSMMAKLNEALAKGQGSAVVDDVLNRLVAYTVTHFAAEEGLLEKHNYPGLAQHRRKHEELRRKVESLVAEHKAGKVGVPATLILFLQGWLKDHILGTDHQYSTFLNGHGVQ